MDDGVLVCECGPIAVSPNFQGFGLGTIIIQAAEDLAVKEYSVQFTQLTVVNWRTDILPFYEKRGFVRVGEKPFN